MKTRLEVTGYDFVPSMSANAWTPAEVYGYELDGYRKKCELEVPGAYKMVKKSKAIIYFVSVDTAHNVHFSRDMRQIIIDFYNRDRPQDKKLTTLRKERFFRFINEIQFGTIEVELNLDTGEIEINAL